MIDWTATVEALGLMGTLGAWYADRRKHRVHNGAELVRKVDATARRIEDHETGCEKAWKTAGASFEEIKKMLADQNELSLTNREAVNEALANIRQDVAVLKENQRVRERQEDNR